jgi:hypothetical protein
MAEERYDKSHHSGATAEQRIANRLKPSAGDDAGDVQTTKGTGPTRTVTSIHHSGHQQHVKPGPDHTTPTPKERDMGRFADPQATLRKEGDNGR